MPMPDPHAESNRRAFEAQAPTFEDPRLNKAFTRGLESLVATIDAGAEDVCLDVAAGTGHVARALAPEVRAVVALDAVEEMLAQGVEQARAAGLRNVVFQRGQAQALPFLDGSFDVVVTRLSLHHMSDPVRTLEEMVRVCRPGGRVVVSDLVRDSGQASPDELERLRDPSHLRILGSEEIAAALESAGATILSSEVETYERPLDPWLEQAKAPGGVAEEIRQRLRRELDGGPATGLQPRLVDGALYFAQLWATVTARRDGGVSSKHDGAPGTGAPQEEPR